MEIEFEGMKFVLTQNLSIRKSDEAITDEQLAQWSGGDLPWTYDGVIEAHTENCLELHSKDRFTSCTVSPSSCVLARVIKSVT